MNIESVSQDASRQETAAIATLHELEAHHIAYVLEAVGGN